jgi:competence ComEA-like helix-hairpin-helix protein
MTTYTSRPERGQLQRQIQAFRLLVLAIAMSLFSSMAMANSDNQMINLNTAGSEALQYIPGIGLNKATSIIELRKQRDGFKNIEELLEVRGIGEKLMEEIRKYGTLEGGVSELTQEMIENPPGKTASVLLQGEILKTIS